MDTAIDVSKLTKQQMLQAMEALWADLRVDDSINSPQWHKKELARREQALKSGSDLFVSLEQAKFITKSRRD